MARARKTTKKNEMENEVMNVQNTNPENTENAIVNANENENENEVANNFDIISRVMENNDTIQSELALGVVYEKADTITEEHFLNVSESDLGVVKGGLERSVKAGSTLEYINCVLVNTIIKKTDSKEKTKQIKEELANILGVKANYVEKMCRVADKFITMSVPCNDVETVADDGKTKTSVVKANYNALLENITSAKVTPLRDKYGNNFRVSAVMEFERLGAEDSKKLINAGKLKASMSNHDIREIVDTIKGKTPSDKGSTGSDNKGGSGAENEVKTDKERVAIALKLLKSITNTQIKEGSKYEEVLEIIESWSEIAK